MDFNDEAFSHIGEHVATADVDHGQFKGTRPGCHFPGRCFEKALEFALKNRHAPGLRLVHGTILKGLRLDHAWIELAGDVVFDPVDQRFYVGDSYKTELAATSEAVYRPREAALQALALNHHGPWHKSEREVLGHGSRPILQQVRKALLPEAIRGEP